MKKILIIVIILIIILQSSKSQVNYDNAIRLRIIPNSNSIIDQNVKNNVLKNIQSEISNLLNDDDTKEKVRLKLKNNLNNFDLIVKNTFIEENYNQNYNINYGINYFPEKEFNDTKIEAGNYESLVITIGEGKGDNWWCFLFPPLCLLEAEKEDTKEAKYDFYLLKIINKIFK